MIQGIEWIIVAVIILVLLLWGPSKLPKLARSFGEAKREFEKAVKEAEEVKKEVESVKQEVKEVGRVVTSPTPTTPTTYTAPSPTPVADDKLLEVAKALGIQTEGKTRDQIAQEIIERTKQTSGQQ